MTPTPTHNALPLCGAEFTTLTEALDYAALGNTGFNFYDGSGKLATVLSYAQLQQDAWSLAQRLWGLASARGARVAIVAETTPDFMRFFFACQYAGLVPVPLPAAIHIGGHKVFIENLERLLDTSQAEVAVAPDTYLPLLKEACRHRKMRFVGRPGDFDRLPGKGDALQSPRPQDLAYLQYTSGSTRFPRGVMVTQAQVMSNLRAIVHHGLQVKKGDRAVSWLPFYHDMGLVGFVLAPLAAQLSVDYMDPRSFAMRPKRWLKLISDNRATMSFSPPFGYELCMKNLKAKDIAQLDLRSWRVAGLGAEPIRPEPLQRFASLLRPAGFDAQAFMAGYGMAECALAVSFSSLGQGLRLDRVDREKLAATDQARPADVDPSTGGKMTKVFVDCGAPLPGYEFEIRGERGEVLPERTVGTLFVRGPSVMAGYFGDPGATERVLAADRWLNTGDRAYRIGRRLVITGREKDMIIINGRNVWPQDLESLAETEPGVRTGDASAFAVAGTGGADQAVLVVQCRNVARAREDGLATQIRERILGEWGIVCTVDLVPRHTLPRTTSGKLSRTRARRDYIHRLNSTRGDAVRPAVPGVSPRLKRAVG
jgi:fatty-acyl-CoA synthase